MGEKYENEIVDRYRKRIARSGPTFESLASGSKKHQEIRFNILKNVGILSGKKILDIGCGIGDFYKFLESDGVKVEYTGVDIVPEFIEECNRRFQKPFFEVRDILEKPFASKSFDIVVCSQVLNYNFKAKDNYSYAKKMLRRMHDFSRDAVACDFLTSYVDYEEEELFYYDPSKIFKFCKGISKRVDLIHSYKLYEFTIYLFKDFEGWKK